MCSKEIGDEAKGLLFVAVKSVCHHAVLAHYATMHTGYSIISLFQTKVVETGHLQQEVTDLRKEQQQVKKDEQVKELLVW